MHFYSELESVQHNGESSLGSRVVRKMIEGSENQALTASGACI